LDFFVTAAVSVVFERLLYSRLYRAAELDQVLFTIGLVFMIIAAVTLIVGPENQPLTLPPSLQGPERPYPVALSHLQHSFSSSPAS
jgi:branched-chain amino acid transport system permease protein